MTDVIVVLIDSHHIWLEKFTCFFSSQDSIFGKNDVVQDFLDTSDVSNSFGWVYSQQSSNQINVVWAVIICDSLLDDQVIVFSFRYLFFVSEWEVLTGNVVVKCYTTGP